MARKTTIMNVNVEEDDEVNLVRDARARSNACFKCGERDISSKIVSMMEINHQMISNHLNKQLQMHMTQ